MLNEFRSRHLTGIFLFLCIFFLALHPTTATADDSYTITFVNGNGNTLQTVTCQPNETPQYTGSTPSRTKADISGTGSSSLTGTATYTFAGWQPDIKPATESTTYKPKFDISAKFTNLSKKITTDETGAYYLTVPLTNAVLTSLAVDPGIQVEFDLTKNISDDTNLTSTEVLMDTGAVNKLAAAKEVSLKTKQADVTLSQEILTYLATLANISCKISQDSTSPIGLTIAFYNGSSENGEAGLIANPGGKFTVTLPYTLSDENAQPIVNRVADGTTTPIAATHENGTVTFTADHSGYYTVTDKVVSEDEFTLAILPENSANIVSAGQNVTYSVTLTQTAKTLAGGSVQTFSLPIKYDSTLTFVSFAPANSLEIQAHDNNPELTLTYSNAAQGFNLATGESIELGKITFKTPENPSIFTDSKYQPTPFDLSSTNNEVAVSGQQNGVAAKMATNTQPTIYLVTVTFPASFNGYTAFNPETSANISPGAKMTAIYGQSFSFALTPDPGYAAPQVKTNLSEDFITPTQGTDGSYIYTLPASENSQILSITAIPDTFSITYMNGENTLTGLTPTSYTYGQGATLPTEVDQNPGYHLDSWHTESTLTDDPVTQIPTTDYGEKVFYAKWAPNPLVLSTTTHTQILTRGSAMQELDLADFIANNGGTDGTIEIAVADGTLPTGLTLKNGKITGIPQSAGSSDTKIRYTSPTGATAELTLTFDVQDIVPLTVSAGRGATFTPTSGHIQQDENLYIIANSALKFTLTVDTGYTATVTATSGKNSRALTPDTGGTYTIPADGITDSVTITVETALNSDFIRVFAKTQTDVTGNGTIFQPFSVYSGNRTLVLFEVKSNDISTISLENATIYQTDHYSGYTHAALLDLSTCTDRTPEGLSKFMASKLNFNAISAENATLTYNNDVNNSGTFSITDISVLYDFTSRTTLQWQPDDALLLIGDLDADMTLDASDVAAMATAYLSQFNN